VRRKKRPGGIFVKEGQIEKEVTSAPFANTGERALRKKKEP